LNNRMPATAAPLQKQERREKNPDEHYPGPKKKKKGRAGAIKKEKERGILARHLLGGISKKTDGKEPRYNF